MLLKILVEGCKVHQGNVHRTLDLLRLLLCLFHLLFVLSGHRSIPLMHGSCFLPVVHQFTSEHAASMLQVGAIIFFVLVKGHLLEGNTILQVLGKYPQACCKKLQVSRKRRLIHASPLAHKKFQHVHYLDAVKQRLLQQTKEASEISMDYVRQPLLLKSPH
ncbi:hypothetical protein PVAP13_6NG090009 [Panicum virgatum]|uniref:Uncharacterized protein n=1 Tax=Panicum virgatum TaxID=38727 RepID=A0A8T0QVK3_PANVG|nr:hypothetical protein PVAP13_6NG090009 [Panicum virgatum]